MNKISEQELTDWIQQYPIVILFFKSKGCSVCTQQLPRIEKIAQDKGIPFKAIDLSENLSLSSSQMVLNVPVTKIFLEGKEIFKEGAFIDFNKIETILNQLTQE